MLRFKEGFPSWVFIHSHSRATVIITMPHLVSKQGILVQECGGRKASLPFPAPGLRMAVGRKGELCHTPPTQLGDVGRFLTDRVLQLLCMMFNQHNRTFIKAAWKKSLLLFYWQLSPQMQKGPRGWSSGQYLPEGRSEETLAVPH